MNNQVSSRRESDRVGANHLLARVDPRDRATMAKWLAPMPLRVGEVIYEPGDPMTHVILPEQGMLSLVAVMADGRLAETAAIGCEGAAGLSASGYVDPSFNRCVVQIAGHALRVEAARFEDMIDMSPEFCSAVTRWRDVATRTAWQTVACNALHLVRERCARWILTSDDRSIGEPLPLTQEYLADILGVKRNAISVVARELQKLGLIAYSRGRVTVLERAGLEQVSCECYRAVRDEFAKLFADTPSSECDD